MRHNDSTRPEMLFFFCRFEHEKSHFEGLIKNRMRLFRQMRIREWRRPRPSRHLQQLLFRSIHGFYFQDCLSTCWAPETMSKCRVLVCQRWIMTKWRNWTASNTVVAQINRHNNFAPATTLPKHHHKTHTCLIYTIKLFVDTRHAK